MSEAVTVEPMCPICQGWLEHFGPVCNSYGYEVSKMQIWGCVECRRKWHIYYSNQGHQGTIHASGNRFPGTCKEVKV